MFLLKMQTKKHGADSLQVTLLLGNSAAVDKSNDPGTMKWVTPEFAQVGEAGFTVSLAFAEVLRRTLELGAKQSGGLITFVSPEQHI